MLTVDAAQFKRFEQEQARQFYRALGEDLLSYCANHIPEIAEPERVPRIKHIFRLCQHYQIESERDITRLSYMLLAFPSDFYQHPEYSWVHDILSAPEAPTTRVDRLSAILRN
ncbi:MAG TPA: hypothetical protein VJ906_01535 [Roseovarius sp.]|nr:hypothetical protein [Roseovarius sp.]